MKHPPEGLRDLVEGAQSLDPIRVAVVNAAQRVVLESLREAQKLGLVEPLLIGDRTQILQIAREIDWQLDKACVFDVADAASAASTGVELVHAGEADAVMKGHLHTDTLMRALLNADNGLRVAGRRVSHVFVTDIPAYPRLLCITDAAVNITPDLNAKAQILLNALEVTRAIGVEMPRVAVLSAVETVNPAIVSTIDAACLTVMARRGQIPGAIVDGPLAFDNAISAEAARAKGIESPVAGVVDVVLVPDLVTGNVLAKNLQYLAGATAAGVVVGLSAPVVLSSRADPVEGRLAALALTVLMHHDHPRQQAQRDSDETQSIIHCAPQPESACCPISR